jgi:hypothetical protein
MRVPNLPLTGLLASSNLVTVALHFVIHCTSTAQGLQKKEDMYQ